MALQHIKSARNKPTIHIAKRDYNSTTRKVVLDTTPNMPINYRHVIAYDYGHTLMKANCIKEIISQELEHHHQAINRRALYATAQPTKILSTCCLKANNPTWRWIYTNNNPLINLFNSSEFPLKDTTQCGSDEQRGLPYTRFDLFIVNQQNTNPSIEWNYIISQSYIQTQNIGPLKDFKNAHLVRIVYWSDNNEKLEKST